MKHHHNKVQFHCFPKRPVSDCDSQLVLNLKRSIDTMKRCSSCGDVAKIHSGMIAYCYQCWDEVNRLEQYQ